MGQANGERAGRVGWLLRSGFNAARDAGFSDPRLRNELLLRSWRVSSRYRGTGRGWRARVVVGSIPRARSATIELEIYTFWDRWDPTSSGPKR